MELKPPTARTRIKHPRTKCRSRPNNWFIAAALTVFTPALNASEKVLYILSDNCINSSSVVAPADGMSWQIDVILHEDSAKQLAVYTGTNIGKRLQFVSGTGVKLGPFSTIQGPLAGHFIIAGYANEVEANAARIEMGKSGACGEVDAQ